MDKPMSTYVRRHARLLLAAFVFCAPQAAHAQNRTIIVQNQCNQTVWPGIYEANLPGGTSQPMNGGWVLPSGQSTTLTLPAGFSGQIWGRKDCTFNASGAGSCETGGCGGLQCNGATGAAGTSLAQFTLYNPNNLTEYPNDSYDVSYVNGYDFPIGITPSNVAYMAPTVSYDMLPTCPPGQQVKNAAGLVVQCLSACEAYGTNSAVPTAVQEVYCCSAPYNSAALCSPYNYPPNPGDLAGPFKSAGPNSYSWPDDSLTSLWSYAGNSTVTYTVTFCPISGYGTIIQTTGNGSYDGPTTTSGAWGGSYTVPATPAGLSAVGGNAQVALSWAAASGALSYNVYRGTATGGESGTAIASADLNTSYTDTTVTNGTTYYYKVAAVDVAGTSGMSNEASAAPAAGPPAAPTGLNATAGNAQVALSWTASSGAASYNVYRGTTSGGEAATAIATAITTTTYTNTGLTNGTAYYFEVAAVNSNGTSGMSNETSATPTSGAPAAPTNLSATAGNAQISLSWTAGSGATSYNIYRGTVSGGESATAIATGITTVSYTNTGLTNGTTYYYKVAALNATGTSGMSNEAGATPSATSSSMVLGINCGGSATGSWVADEDFAGGTADVVANTINTATVTNPAPVAVYQSNRYGTCTYTIGGLTASTSYTVRLHFCETYWDAAGDREFNVSINSTQVLTNFDIWNTAGGENIANIQQFSATSNASGQIVVGFTTTVDNAQVNGIEIDSSSGGSVPSAPTGLTAAAGNAQVALSWTASSGATSYNVYRGTASGGESATAIATGITTTSYTNTGLTNGTAYYYKVAALNSYGTSAQSTEVSSTPASGVPAAPTGLTATAGNAQVSLSWTASSGATSYNVYRGTASGGESATAIATGITTASYTNTGLTNGTAYYYKVAALNSSGTSAQSSEVSATPTASATMILGINCGGSATGSWVADEDFNGGTETSVTNTVTTTAVTNPAPEAVYQSNRYGALTYTIGGLTASTGYVVRLHFAETYFDAAGDRTFDVSINSTQVLTNFDIFKTAGAENAATIQQFNATSNSSGQIIIVFTLVVNQPQINGIEIDN